jgi:regulator of sigma E protease
MLTLLMFGVLVTLHEGGHFLVARFNGITVNEFAIGMGPKLFSHVSKKSGIRYSVRALPIGGYVSMEGEDSESDDPNSFLNKNVWRRIATVFAGPAVNLVVGFLCMILLVTMGSNLATTEIHSFAAEGAVSNAQLMAGDEVVKVGSTRVHTWNELTYEIMNQGYKPVDITVIRDGQTVVLEDVEFPTFEDAGATFGQYDFYVVAVPKSFGGVIYHSFWRSISTVKMVWDSLVGIFSGRFGVQSISGPIGVAEVVGEATKSPFPIQNLVYLLALLSINLGVMNFLPIPGLDGGRLLFLLIEAVTGHHLDRRIEGYINAVCVMLLLALIILVGIKDIVNLF